MRKVITAGLVATAAAALTVSLGAASSGATTATTWTVQPGGSVTGKASHPTLKDTATGTVVTCQAMTTAGTAKSGTGLTNPLGKVTSVTFTNCVGPDSIALTVTASASTAHPWKLDGLSYSNGVTHGKLTGIKGSLSGSGCTATVAGTTATTPGMVTGTYTNSTHVLKASGGNLHIWNVSSGCLNLAKNGDPTTLKGNVKITPGQTITSP
jgi:hypothetical protein